MLWRRTWIACVLVCMLAALPVVASARVGTDGYAWAHDMEAEPLLLEGRLYLDATTLPAWLAARGAVGDVPLPKLAALGLKIEGRYAEKKWVLDTVKEAEALTGVRMVRYADMPENFGAWLDIPEALFDDAPGVRVDYIDADGQRVWLNIVFDENEAVREALTMLGMFSPDAAVSESGYVVVTEQPGADARVYENVEVQGVEAQEHTREDGMVYHTIEAEEKADTKAYSTVVFVAQADLPALESGEATGGIQVIYSLTSVDFSIEALLEMVETM